MYTVARFRLLLVAVQVAAAAVVSAAPGESEIVKDGPPTDVIISRDGVLQGTLAGCAGGSCRIDSVSIARPWIIWIGLQTSVGSLPAPGDPLRDEVHRRDGSVHPGRLVGINADEVVTERGRHPRATVAWVYLTPEAKDTRQDGGVPAALPAPDGEGGALWTGKIESTWVATIAEGTLRRNSRYEPVRLRENTYPLLVPQDGRLVPAGSVVLLVSESTVATEQSSFTGVCSSGGGGSTTLSGIQTSGGSGIWKKSVDLDTTPGIGWDVPSGPASYQLSLGPPQGQTYAIIGCNSTWQESYSPVVIGRYPLNGMNPLPMDPQMRFLDSDGSRMSGSYTAPMSNGQVTVSWDLCRAGSRSCGTAPPAGTR